MYLSVGIKGTSLNLFTKEVASSSLRIVVCIVIEYGYCVYGEIQARNSRESIKLVGDSSSLA